MSPEEFHRDLTNAFNWPWVELVKYPLKYSKGGGTNNIRMMQFPPMKGGSAMKIQQMRDSVSQFARGLEEIDISRYSRASLTETGYYFKSRIRGYKEIESITYYDKDTKIITLCNLNPENRGIGEYFFFNEYPAKNLMLGEIPPITVLGNYYSPKLPNQYNFINWVNTNPLSSRK